MYLMSLNATAHHLQRVAAPGARAGLHGGARHRPHRLRILQQIRPQGETIRGVSTILSKHQLFFHSLIKGQSHGDQFFRLCRLQIRTHSHTGHA